MRLRVGLVGLGDAWQTRHAPALRAMSDRFEVRAICEQVAHRAEDAARDFGATQVDGFRMLVARDDVDAILMLAPQWYGALPISAACDAGKAVYCCVALDVEMDEAAQLKQRVDEAGIAFMAEFPKRLAPASLRLKELIATRLGSPRLIFCHQRLPAPKTRGKSNSKDKASSHDLVELVDWCRFVVGREPATVVGVGHPAVCPDHGTDYEMLSLDFAHPDEGCVPATAQISCGRYVPAPWREAISFRPPAAMQVVCEKGMAFLDLPATLIWFDDAGRHQESLESERPVGEQLLAHFHRAVTSLVRRSSDLEDAYRSMLIVSAGRNSQCDGRRAVIEF